MRERIARVGARSVFVHHRAPVQVVGACAVYRCKFKVGHHAVFPVRAHGSSNFWAVGRGCRREKGVPRQIAFLRLLQQRNENATRYAEHHDLRPWRCCGTRHHIDRVEFFGVKHHGSHSHPRFCTPIAHTGTVPVRLVIKRNGHTRHRFGVDPFDRMLHRNQPRYSRTGVDRSNVWRKKALALHTCAQQNRQVQTLVQIFVGIALRKARPTHKGHHLALEQQALGGFASLFRVPLVISQDVVDGPSVDAPVVIHTPEVRGC